MSKRRKTGYKIDSEYFAQLDYLGAEYSAALEKIEEQNKDIRKLIALLVEHDVVLVYERSNPPAMLGRME